MDLKTVEMGRDFFRVLEIYHAYAVWLDDCEADSTVGGRVLSGKSRIIRLLGKGPRAWGRAPRGRSPVRGSLLWGARLATRRGASPVR